MDGFSPRIFFPLVHHYFPEPQASLFLGLLLGVPLKTTPQFATELKIVGLTHLVVLSGSNITLLISMIGSATRRLSKQISFVITILSIVLFVAFVRPQAPIVRAAIMSLFTLVSDLSGRKVFSLSLLVVSFLIIAIFWPSWISTISLQLSYGATIGIILFGSTKVQNSKDPDSIRSQLTTYSKEELRISLAAQVFTTPLIFYHFHQISFIAPISNILVSWTIAPIMTFGIMTLFLGSIHPTFGLIPAVLCYGLLFFMTHLVKLLASVPFVFFTW